MPWTIATKRTRRGLPRLRTLPEVLGPEDLPKLNEGLRYLFEERQAQAEFRAGNHLDGAYLSLLAVKFFLALFRTTGFDGLAMPLLALESALWELDEESVDKAKREVWEAFKRVMERVTGSLRGLQAGAAP